MTTNHTPAPKIISVEETEDFIIKWYNEHLSFKQITGIINERAEKIVTQNAELLEALEELVLVAKTFELLPSKWVDPLIKAENLLNKANN